MLLDVDFKRKLLQGFVELTILPKEELQKIRLNARQLYIHRISVNEADKFTTYQYQDPIAPVLTPDMYNGNLSVYNHSEYRDRYPEGIESGDLGELVVDVPYGAVVRADVNGMVKSEGNVPVAYKPFKMRIYYSLMNPKAGIQCVMPVLDIPPLSHRWPHMFTCSEWEASRLWMPCAQKTYSRSTWDFEFHIPRTVRDALPQSMHSAFSEDALSRKMLLVCSGELVEQCMHPQETSKTIFKYIMDKKATASSMAWSVGPYEMIEINGWKGNVAGRLAGERGVANSANTDEEIEGSGFAFCLPGHQDEMKYTVNTNKFVGQACDFLTRRVYSPYPYRSFKLVFVEESPRSFTAAASIGILSTHLLLKPTIIDQTYETRRILVRTVSDQWYGHYIQPKTWWDVWLIVGLSNFIASMYLRRIMGQNEFKSRLKQDMDRVIELDVNQPPLYPMTGFNEVDETLLPIDPLAVYHAHPDDDVASVRAEFVELKSSVIMHMLDRRFSSKGHESVITKASHSIMTGKATKGITQNSLSTKTFLKIMVALTQRGVEIQQFATNWIRGAGCPQFTVTYKYLPRYKTFPFKIEQKSTSIVKGATAKFSGMLTIRVFEPAEVYDYEVQINDYIHTFKDQVKSQSRYKKLRTRQAGRKMKGAENAGAEDIEADEVPEQEVGTPPPSTVEPGVEEEVEDTIIRPEKQPLRWIRLDPEKAWLCTIKFEQHPIIWYRQIQEDRDVFSQHDALEALASYPTIDTLNVLEAVMMDHSVYYRIRMEAALILATCNSDDPESTGARLLLSYFQNQYCMPSVNDEVATVTPMSHNFTQFPEYFVKKAVPTILSKVRDQQMIVPIEIRQFLWRILAYSENSGNPYSDDYFIAALIDSVGEAFSIRHKPRAAAKKPDFTTHVMNGVQVEEEVITFEDEVVHQDDENEMAPTWAERGGIKDQTLFEQSLKQIERYRLRDRMTPSYQNVITRSCLEALAKWMFAGMIPVDLSLFLPYTRYGHFILVRTAALDALILLDALKRSDILTFILSMIREDPVPHMRYYTAKALADFVSLAAHVVHVDTGNGPAEFEEAELWMRTRRHLGNLRELREEMWQMLNVDAVPEYRIRKELLRFCELVYDPADNPHVPKVSLLFKPGAGVKSVSSTASTDKPSTMSPRGSIQYDDAPLQPPDPEFIAICRKLLERLRNHSCSAPFIWPVDTSVYPDYSKLIERPMDLTTVTQNVQRGIYHDDLERVAEDIRLIFENCYRYNRDDSQISQNARKMEESFNQVIYQEALLQYQLWKATEIKMEVDSQAEGSVRSTPESGSGAGSVGPPPAGELERRATISLGLSDSDKVIAKRVLKKLTADPAAQWFLAPVPRNVVGYYQRITRPMDFGKVAENIEKNLYFSLKDVEKDIMLVFRNCYEFNGTSMTDVIVQHCAEAESLFRDEWRREAHLEPPPPIVKLPPSRAPIIPVPQPRAPIPMPGSKPSIPMPGGRPSIPMPGSKPSIPMPGSKPSISIPRSKPSIPLASSIRKPDVSTESVKSKAVELKVPALPHPKPTLKQPTPVTPPASQVAADGVKAKAVDLKVPTLPPPRPILKQPAPVTPQVAQKPSSAHGLSKPHPVSVQSSVTGISKPVAPPASSPPNPILKQQVAATPQVAQKPSSAHGLSKPHPVSVQSSVTSSSKAVPSSASSQAHPPSALTKAASINDVSKAKLFRILEDLIHSDDSLWFRELPDRADPAWAAYFAKVKKPMALRPVESTLKKGGYATTDDFQKDMNLIFNNAYTFNARGTVGFGAAKKLEKAYRGLWNRNFPDGGRGLVIGAGGSSTSSSRNASPAANDVRKRASSALVGDSSKEGSPVIKKSKIEPASSILTPVRASGTGAVSTPQPKNPPTNGATGQSAHSQPSSTSAPSGSGLKLKLKPPVPK
ncbi:hypothetical protein SeLEV6574_g03876 [Synchytrium endobioticum]|uniref:Transcription initiation factor TFIID subunit 2 n=1 Tax=Synchytrium endobioticum TaxID=286115 RepID=A0A507D2E8_9FUNG|nr:hypothetical protein SeLEV6574_g03876 [Synchytrium endobioticum]